MIAEAVILAGCKAVESIFTFLCTPEGQATAKEWRENGDKAEAFFQRVFSGIKPLFPK